VEATKSMAEKGIEKLDATLNIGQPDKTMMGAGVLAAMGRQGFKELGAAFSKAFPNYMQIEELGSLGNRVTPQEVFAAKKNITPEKTLQLDMDR